jgi:N6-adenosine-specific RNA methylase IME4
MLRKQSREIAHTPKLQNGTGLKFYDAACAALERAKRVDEVKDIKNHADAMKCYARQANNKTLEADAAEIRLRAVRMLGQYMEAQRASVGFSKGTRGSKVKGARVDAKPALNEAGIGKSLADQARKLAKLPAGTFESLVDQTRKAVERGVERNAIKTIELTEARPERAKVHEKGDAAADLEALIASGKKFPVVYTDPPREFRVDSGEGEIRRAERRYDTMSIDEIKALPVADLAAANCALLMWVALPELPGGLKVIKAWRFEYKTVAIVWLKSNEGATVIELAGNGLFSGKGDWTCANVEVCLLATKGNPSRLDNAVHQVVVAPAGEHGRKPEEVRKRIERLFAGPYLELFARGTVEGWTTWAEKAANPEALANVIEQLPRVAAEVDAAGTELAKQRGTERRRK